MDVWVDRDSFLLEKDGSPSFVAGVPPDYFSKTGQRWAIRSMTGNRWRRTSTNSGYAALPGRTNAMTSCGSTISGPLTRTGKIPASCETAIEGEWVEGPQQAFFDRIYECLPDIELVAEDLGEIRPEVTELKDANGLPGMDVLLFRMEPKLLKKPAAKNSIVYTGTHDNDTAEEAYSKFTHNRRIALRRFFHNRDYHERNFHDLLVHFALDCDADCVHHPAAGSAWAESRRTHESSGHRRLTELGMEAEGL